MRFLRAALLLLTLFSAACVGRRQPETVPDATLPDGTPLIVRDSAAPRPQQAQPIKRVNPAGSEDPPAFIGLSMDMHSALLSMDDGGFPVPDRRISQMALEAQILPLRGYGVGAAARILIGDRNGPLYNDAALLFGSRAIAADLGFASRRTWNIRSQRFYDSTFVVFRPGIRSRVNIGETGASVHGRAARYFELPDGGDGPRARLKGWNAEAGASYTVKWRYPLTASIGYRREHVQVYNRKQDLSAFTLGASLLIGRQVPPLPPPSDTTQRR